MKTSNVALLAVGLAIGAADSVASAQVSVRVGVDSFAVRFTGAPEGRHLFVLERYGSGYRYRDKFAIGDMLSRDATVYLTSTLAVDSVRRTGIEFGQQVSASVDYRGRRVSGRAVLTGPNGPHTVVLDTLLPAGAFDGQALYPLLFSKTWAVGETRIITIFGIDEQSITSQTLRVLATEEITVPAGRFDALVAELTTTQLPVKIWVSATTPHRLLKVSSANGESVLLP